MSISVPAFTVTFLPLIAPAWITPAVAANVILLFDKARAAEPVATVAALTSSAPTAEIVPSIFAIFLAVNFASASETINPPIEISPAVAVRL